MTTVVTVDAWAYLGPESTFTEQAARELASDQQLLPHDSVSAALAAVRAGSVTAAVVPLENSVEGTVTLTQDELIHGTELRIVAEVFVRVRFDLLAVAGTARANVRTVGSHPHGHAQVRHYLAEHYPHAEAVITSSTAAAAAAVAAGELDAAAAAPVAGVRYRLEPLATDIGLSKDAVTRFVLLRPPGPPPPATGNDRTSWVMSVPNTPGSLLAVLGEIADRGVNLTRLESRPTRASLGEYFFLIDADGHLADPAIADTLAALHRRGVLHRFLGSYPQGVGAAAPWPTHATADTYAAADAFVRQLKGENPCGSS